MLTFGMLAVLIVAIGLWQTAFSSVPSAHAMDRTPLGQPCATVYNTGAACVGAYQPLSAQEQAILNAKQALATEYAKVRAGKLSYAMFQRDWTLFVHHNAPRYAGPSQSLPMGCPSTPGRYTTCGANSVNLVQQAQTTSYYCGPATAHEVLGVKGNNTSQSTLAGNAYLQTNSLGQTPWSGPRVMGPTLNTLLGTAYYVPQDGSGGGNPNGFSQTTWMNDLTLDIDNGWAIAGNVYEVAGGLHLPGHPKDQPIWHWIGIKGYTNYGYNSTYADSVYGATKVLWHASVTQPYYTISSSNMTTLLNGRGFVW